ncbi:signal transduction histidine kinase [Robbsia andropogonis]|uniref:response regulator n=1 Tax=Robbsia andropogonis TaxID=28092 RepID=UPI000B251CAD|nr:response regulator [Robbsia andropogonis]MCP1119307.1 response regulator [Robbsia andropogonis]MCP1129147.1 response regulator [Robbsia andropogonis]
MRIDPVSEIRPTKNDRIFQVTQTGARLLPIMAMVVVLFSLWRQAGAPGRAETQPVAMAMLTSIGIVCLSCSGLLHPQSAERSIRALNGAALATALIALLSQVFTGADVISPVLSKLAMPRGAASQAQTSIATAVTIALLSIGQLRRLAQHTTSADYLTGAAMLFASAALLGSALGVPDLHHIFLYSTMATSTAMALFILALAFVVADPTRGWAALITSTSGAGRATRRHLVLALFPILVAAGLLRGVHAAVLSVEAAMTFAILLILAPLVILTFREGGARENREKATDALARFQQQAATDLKRQLAEQAALLLTEGEERRKAESGMYRAQRLEALGQVTGGIAHDFNNVLMAISGNLHLMRQFVSVTHPGHGYLESIAMAAQRGAKLTKQLLVFSRTQLIDVRAVALDTVIEGARELVGNALGPDVNVVLDLQTADVWVRTDPEQLQLAILNLAINARDAMPNGGNLRIGTSASVIEAVDGQPRQFVAVHVVDDGIGMSADVAARAIEPFFTTKEASKRSGLGLAQVYGVMRQSGGELRITSDVGRGTTVDLLLLRTDPVGHAEDIAPPSTPPTIGVVLKAPVLLIDDDDEVRAAMAELFRCSGYDVVEAADGKIGLEALASIKPAVAVIDYLMPGLNGAQVARLARDAHPTLPIIFVSGYADTMALDQLSDAVVLRKPVPIDELLATVARFAVEQ